jgi:hypothetical protein
MRHPGEVDPDERARRWIAICIGVSLLLHISLLLIPLSKHTLSPAAAASSQVQGPLTIRLTRTAPRAAPAETPPPAPAPHRRPVIAMRHPTSSTAPSFTVPPPPETTPPEPAPQPAPPEEDMLSKLEARRAARAAAEQEAAVENAAAAEAAGGPSVNQRIMDNINRAKNGAVHGIGTGGVFEVTKIGVREGSFRFNGWHPESGDNWRESYTVDAGEGGNVQLAIVKKVIDVIRKYKKGDFEFESRLYGHPVTMSARPEDGASLETFLMKELFQEDTLAHPQARR